MLVSFLFVICDDRIVFLYIEYRKDASDINKLINDIKDLSILSNGKNKHLQYDIIFNKGVNKFDRERQAGQNNFIY